MPSQATPTASTATIIDTPASDETPTTKIEAAEAQTATIVATPDEDQTARYAQTIAAASTAAFAESSSRPTEQAAPTTPMPTVMDAAPVVQSAPEPSPRKSKTPIIIGAVAAAVAVAAVAVGFALASTGPQPQSAPAPATTAEVAPAPEATTTPEPETHEWATGENDNNVQSEVPPASSSSSAPSASSSSSSATTTPRDPEMHVAPTPTAKSFTLAGGGQSWGKAKEAAASAGMELACIKSQAEYDEVVAKLQQSEYIAAYLGGYYDIDANQWMWVDGTPFTYTNWAPGEPNNETGDEYFLAFLKGPDGWGWYDCPKSMDDIYTAWKIGYVEQSL